MIPFWLQGKGAGMRGSDADVGVAVHLCGPRGAGSGEHPLRKIRAIVNEALASLDGEFGELYEGRAGSRSRRRSCCAPRFCRRSSRCAPSGS